VCDTIYGGVLGSPAREDAGCLHHNQNHFNGLNGMTKPVWMSLNFIIRRYIRFLTMLSYLIIRHRIGQRYKLSFRKAKKNSTPLPGLFLNWILPVPLRPGNHLHQFWGEPYKLPMYQMLRRSQTGEKDLSFDVFYTGSGPADSTDNFVSHGMSRTSTSTLPEQKLRLHMGTYHAA